MNVRLFMYMEIINNLQSGLPGKTQTIFYLPLTESEVLKNKTNCNKIGISNKEEIEFISKSNLLGKGWIGKSQLKKKVVILSRHIESLNLRKKC